MKVEARLIWIKSHDFLKDDKEYVVITIGNEGSYIDQEAIQRLFAKFYTYKKKNGTGLGLAICYDIVKSHGGQISCKSDKIKGTEFVFTLPAF